MATGKRRRLFFELSKKEKESRFKSVLNPVLKKNAELNLPIILKNSSGHKLSQFVYKYPNGKQELIEKDLKKIASILGDSSAIMVM